MDGIETTALFEEKITVTPRDLATQNLNLHALILAKVSESMEGKCSLHGWVLPDTLKVLSRTMGYLESGRFTGDIVFHVQAEAKVLNPPSGSHLTCEVIGNNMMGIYASYRVPMKEVDRKTKKVTTSYVDAIKVILPRDLHIGDEEFTKVQIGDKIHVGVKKSRFQVNDKFVLSVGIFEGKVGSDYSAPEVKEEEELKEDDESLGKAVQERLGAYEVKESEEEQKQREEMPPPLEETVLVVEEASAPKEPLPGARPTLVGAPAGLPYASGEPIYFNGTKVEAFKELDTRYPASFSLDETEWPSVEHYYQASKFPEFPELQEQIRQAPTAAAAGKLGKTKSPETPIRADWQTFREIAMRNALVAKFDQNPPLKKLLLDTYPRPIVFADPNDSFWGYGRTKMGKNKLGQMLMDYRSTHTGMEAVDG
jgi:N-glycosidase YbiA